MGDDFSLSPKLELAAVALLPSPPGCRARLVANTGICFCGALTAVQQRLSKSLAWDIIWR
jgi:hypothetical protein